MSQRTITLTGRPPVKIDEDNWPQIASATDSDHDNQYEFQANRKWAWSVRVRQHADGRAIVYATYSYDTCYQGEPNVEARRGELLQAGATTEAIVEAIREVCGQMREAEHHSEEDAERWDRLMHECIADMPAEELS